MTSTRSPGLTPVDPRPIAKPPSYQAIELQAIEGGTAKALPENQPATEKKSFAEAALPFGEMMRR